MSRFPASRAGALPLLAPLFLLGCQQPDLGPSGSLGKGDANLAKDSFLLRLSNPSNMSTQMDSL